MGGCSSCMQYCPICPKISDYPACHCPLIPTMNCFVPQDDAIGCIAKHMKKISFSDLIDLLNSSRLTFWGFIGYTIFVALFTWIFVARRKNKEAKQIRTSHMAQNIQTDNVQSNSGNWLPIISAILPYVSGSLDRVATALPTILSTENQNLNNGNLYAGPSRTMHNSDNVQFGNENIRFGNVVRNEDIEATSRQMQGVYNNGNRRIQVNQRNQFMESDEY